MKGKLLFVAGGVVGYVLGARAGRKRYEQIKKAANRVWESPSVQKQMDKVEEFASQKLGEVPEIIGTAAKKAVSGVVDRMTSGDKAGNSGKSGAEAGGDAAPAGAAASSSRKRAGSTGTGSGLDVPTDAGESAAADVASEKSEKSEKAEKAEKTVDEARAKAAKPPRSAVKAAKPAKAAKTGKDESL